jgi:hypothetical protein
MLRVSGDTQGSAYYVHIRQDEMKQMQLAHLFTTIEPELSEVAAGRVGQGCIAGATEWCGVANGRLVTIGWDWIRLQDMAIGILDPLRLRTNVMMLDTRGAAVGDDLTATFLLAYLRRISWQDQLRPIVLKHEATLD